VGTSLAAEPLLALAVTVTSEQRVDSVLQSTVQGLASQPGVALARIWLVPSADLLGFCRSVSDPADYLCLVASAGTPINSPGEDWCFLQEHFARMPFNVGKVGQVAASRRPILVEDVAAENDWILPPEWARREEIRSFGGYPLIFRDRLLGIVAVFSRHPLGQQEFTWLGLFANQAALAISNACAEQALRSSAHNLGAIIDTIPTLAWCNLPDGSNEFLNKGWHEYTGLSHEESHGWGWQVAFHPEDLPPLMEKWQKMLVSGESDEIEARLRRHDGVYRWFLIRAQALRDNSGEIVRWYGTSTDIEDRKRAEEAQRTSEHNLAAIINTIPTTAWTARPDGYCDFLNQGWLDYTGLTAEKAQGWGWVEAIHPHDREQLAEDWQSSLASGIPVDTEARIRRFDSSYRWFLIRANPLKDEAGNILKWYGTCVDIEDRKHWEQILRARELSWKQIVDNIPGLVATTGAMGEVEFLNRQTLEYFGRTNEELKDWALIGAVHPDDLPRVIDVRKKSIETGQIYEVEHRCRRADGIYRWFQVRGLPVRDAENKVTAWYLLLTDIDDRKKAEEDLQSSQRNLSLTIDAIPGMIHTARPDGYLDYFNRRWLEYLGCSLSDIEGWKWTNLIHPDDLQGIVDKWRACLASGEIFEHETRVRREDGQYRWMFHRKVPLRDENENIVRWYGTSLDIEDRKRAEEALQSSERNLSLMISAIPTYIHVLRTDGSVLYANQAVLDYFGITIDDVQKDDYRARFFHPEDVERLREERREALQHPVPFENEQRVLGKDGVYRWFLIRYNPLLDEQGRIDRWYAAATDIDGRKRAEAQVQQAYLRLAEAQRLSKTGSFITDLVADEHNWSEETFRIFDFGPATKVTVQRIRDIIHPEDLPSFEAMIARAMTGVDVDFIFRIVTSRNAMKHIRGMARIMVQDADRPLFIGALQDITESKMAEEALDRARSELARVARVTTMNTLTASIAHEIKQPLASLITNASIALRRLNADPPNVDGARETVQRTIRDANRASDVITRLRALFSKKEFTLETLDLNEVTTEVIALSLSDLQRDRVILRSELAEDLPPVIGDRVQLQQVTLNLMRNASDAMVCVEDRPRQLLVRTQRDGDDRVRLSVQDAGCGVDPQDFERLFEAFYTTKTGGMGIGLSVSRSIIERHQGRLWAEPNNGPGTTFFFSIPCGPVGAKDAAA
jgi:PAS domain S-box-containing protein